MLQAIKKMMHEIDARADGHVYGAWLYGSVVLNDFRQCCRFANDVCLRAHRANIASLRHEVTQHHFGAQAEIHHQPPTAAASLPFNHFGLIIDI